MIALSAGEGVKTRHSNPYGRTIDRSAANLVIDACAGEGLTMPDARMLYAQVKARNEATSAAANPPPPPPPPAPAAKAAKPASGGLAGLARMGSQKRQAAAQK